MDLLTKLENWKTLKPTFRVEAFLIGALVFIAGVASSAVLPLTWDEGDAFVRAASVSIWTEALIVGPSELTKDSARRDTTRVYDGATERYEDELRGYFGGFEDRGALFSTEALRAGWPHTIYREGHPSGYSIALAVGRWIATPFRAFISEKQGFRIVGVLLFALAVGACYYRVASCFGRYAALVSAFCVVCSPRVFGHVQIAGGDSLLISSWLLAWVLFDGALRSKRKAVLWGLALGISFCSKFSGFLVVAPFALVLAFEIIRETITKTRSSSSKRKRVFLFALGVCVGCAVFFATNPTLWNRPVAGLLTFWKLNTVRADFNIPIYFLGKLYSPQRPLPWWNGFFWLGSTLPLGSLLLAFCGFSVVGLKLVRFKALENEKVSRRALIALAAIGAFLPMGIPIFIVGTLFVAGIHVLRPKDPDKEQTDVRALLSALALGLTLPVVRCLPGLPVHDGARLMIASFSFWGVLAGFGAKFLYEVVLHLKQKNFRVSRWLPVGTVVLVVCANVVDLARSCPQYLSFYNLGVGGVTGAVALDLEPTYYWDSFDASVVSTLEKEMARAQQEGRPTGALFAAFSSQTLDYYRRWGLFKPRVELATVSSPGALASLERFGFYILQRRPSAYSRLDLELLKSEKPIFRKMLRNPIEPFHPLGLKFSRAKEAVALEVYDARAVRRALGRLSSMERAKKSPENKAEGPVPSKNKPR